MKKQKALFIIDAQNDFCHPNGALLCENSQTAVDNIKKLLETVQFDMIVCTADTHHGNYLNTIEGKHLPIEHCINNTWGHKIHKDIHIALWEQNCDYTTVNKDKFMLSENIVKAMFNNDLYDFDIYVCGFATDICVLNNALQLKSVLSNKYEISVIENCCAGTSAKNHNKAIELMKVNHINIL